VGGDNCVLMHISLLLWIVNHGGVSVDYQNISDDRHSSYYTKMSFQKKKRCSRTL